MDARELERIIVGVSDRLPKALLENRGIEEVVFAIGHIAAYLKSEQQKRIELNNRIEQHQKMMTDFDKMIWGDRNDLEKFPGIAHEWVVARQQRKEIKKLMVAVLTAVLVAMVLGFLNIMGFKIK